MTQEQKNKLASLLDELELTRLDQGREEGSSRERRIANEWRKDADKIRIEIDVLINSL